MQHLREVSEFGQLPGPPHAGPLRREAVQVHRVRPVLHHQWEHAQVGEGGRGLVAGTGRVTEVTSLSDRQREDLPENVKSPELCSLGGRARGVLFAHYLRSVVRGVSSRGTEAAGLGLWPFGG